MGACLSGPKPPATTVVTQSHLGHSEQLPFSRPPAPTAAAPPPTSAHLVPGTAAILDDDLPSPPSSNGTITPVKHSTQHSTYSSHSAFAAHPRDLVLVGIDFGTSRSGYAFSMDEDRVILQSRYPGETDPTPKTLTAMLYKINGPSDWQPIAWGMDAYKQYHTFTPRDRPSYAYIHHFKLALLDDSPECAVPLPAGCPLPAMSIVTHFLQFMLLHIDQTLLESYGTKYRRNNVLWCMTVPAKCSDVGKDRLRQACCQAGMISNPRSDKLALVHEPEAAALTARDQGKLHTRLGQTFLVIDAGGGTVDLTIHTVIEKNGRGVLSEATHREGLLAGSSFVDEQFRKYMATYLGGSVFQEWQSHHPQDFIKFMSEEWERVKRNFKGSDPDQQSARASVENVSIPNTLYRMLPEEVKQRLESEQDGWDDRVVLRAAQVERFFNVVAANIVVLAETMIRRAGKQPDQVLLVGGLGSSPYLYQRVSMALPSVQVVMPTFGYAAIVEGAVLYAREPALLYQRRSCLTYGIETSAPWTPGAPDRILMAAFNKYMTSHYFLKFVVTDQLVTVSDVVRYRFVPISPSQSHCHFDIYASADPNVQFIEDGKGVQLIATVTVPVSMNPGGKPEDSVISLMFKFGTTEIEVLAEEEKTLRRVAATITFSSLPPAAGALGLDHTPPYVAQSTGHTGSAGSEMQGYHMGVVTPGSLGQTPRWA